MNRKKALALSTLLILIVGICLLFIPFAKSLLPSEKTISKTPRLDLADINKGNLKFFPHPTFPEISNKYKWAVLIYRKKDNSIKAWDVPVKNGNVGMPDLQWWRPTYQCKNFGPTIVEGLIDESQPIKCHDKKQLSKWWANEWRWDIDGNSLGSMVADLQKTRGYQKNNEFIFK